VVVAVERQSERVVFSEVGKAGHMGKGPYFIDAREGEKDSDECRIG
jgi:hypothetical protein